jgi:ubiquinone/menaquinone biosynthesis C-methylase UbiE
MKRVSPREGYDLYAASYKKDHPHLDSFMDGAESIAWFRALEALVVQNRVVALDIGCGDGRTLGRWVRGVEKRGWADRVEFHGADISPKMLEVARGRIAGPSWHLLDLELLQSASDWSLHHGPAGLVSAFFVLVHFERPEVFFENIGALLRTGGKLVMNTLPQPSAPELRAGGKPLVIEAWDHKAEDVVEAGETAGFALERREDFHENGQLVSTLLEWVKL